MRSLGGCMVPIQSLPLLSEILGDPAFHYALLPLLFRYVVPPAHRQRFEQVMQSLAPGLYRQCPEFLRHKVRLAHLAPRAPSSCPCAG